MVHVPTDGEAPLGWIDPWDVEVGEQIVQADRSDRILQRFQRQRVIPRRELQLFEHDIRPGRQLRNRLLLDHGTHLSQATIPLGDPARRPPRLVLEVAFAGEDHGHAGRVRGGDGLGVLQ